MDDVKVIRRGMIFVAISGKVIGKGYTEQEAVKSLQKKLERQRNEESPKE